MNSSHIYTQVNLKLFGELNRCKCQMEWISPKDTAATMQGGKNI